MRIKIPKFFGLPQSNSLTEEGFRLSVTESKNEVTICAISADQRVVSVSQLEEWERIMEAEGFGSLADEMLAIINNKDQS